MVSRLTKRLTRIDVRRPAPAIPPGYDLSRLTDDDLDLLLRLRERIDAVGPDGLTPDELEEAGRLVAILTGGEGTP
jgi:hypothetical protein